ncbi:CD276 antigen-like [Acipenser oxyrinchus oxyrinchus]|uniref:CD276 antigen-like n=1 Tax=Acipenser oxyrinchus oxyrinchus TaxID=40147 RepID=A0AAD8FS28_ACIOX|nr:CD276 antigen-like [Acipenser oxyrinchus oxyrinchus]
MDSAGEEESLNSPELPCNQLYLKRRTESRIQLRRRVCFTGPAAAAVTRVSAILILAAGSVSSDSEFVQVPSSVKCTEGQDCILSCTFNYTAGGWDEKSGVIWRRAETDHIVHGYYNNRDQLADQLPQYVSRTSLFDSELQHGNASLLLRRVREEDAGKYICFVKGTRLPGSGLTEVVVVPAPPTTAPAHVTVPSSVKCTEGQDCILSCTFNYTAGGWDEKSGVIWRRAETGRIVHCYHDNTNQLADQIPQYVNRTSLFDSELQRGNASLLLRRVREEDAGEYRCFVSTPRLSGSGLTEVVVVPAQRHHWWGLGAVPLALCVIAGLCVGLWHAGCCRKSNLASSLEQAVSFSDMIEEPSEVRLLPCTAQYTQFNTSSQNEIVTLN